MQVKIIEQDWKKCEDLCDQLPKATIICGNAADHDLLIEEGIEQADALVSLTGMDEENIILANQMYLKRNMKLFSFFFYCLFQYLLDVKEVNAAKIIRQVKVV